MMRAFVNTISKFIRPGVHLYSGTVSCLCGGQGKEVFCPLDKKRGGEKNVSGSYNERDKRSAYW